MIDVCVIGAGICGSFLAYDLSHYEGEFVVLEKEHDIANGITMANSAIVHAGYDPEEGTLKAKLNVEGAHRYPVVTKEIGADYQVCGAYVVATEKAQKEQLMKLYQQGTRRGVRCNIIDQDELRKAVPHICKQAIAALSVPDTAIINPWEVAIDLMECAILNGVKLYLDEEVMTITKQEGYYEIQTTTMSLQAKKIINAAGLGAERIAELIEGSSPFHMQIKRGQYYVLSKQAKSLCDHVIYPLPNKLGKGVLCVPTTHGNTLLGPSAEMIEEEDNGTTQEGLAYVKQQVSQLMEDVPFHEVIRSYSGLRPCGNHQDFYIEESKTHPGVIHLGCIDSPGLASAPAISRYVIDEFLPTIKQNEKTRYQKREQQICCATMSEEEHSALIKEQPAYGHIICRCEKISEGEILDSIRRVCGASSIKGVKKRVRPGMGRCQGGFCEVEVAKILARELNIPCSQVLYDSLDSALGEEAKR